MSFQLRPYQQESVDSVVLHFKSSNDPCVVVLPTGAGKSLVIAELAKIAFGNVLALAHVKELVDQNHQKFVSYGIDAGIYSAGLQLKETTHKVTFGSIQSVARSSENAFKDVSILIVDECHRISISEDTQYMKFIRRLQKSNSKLCVVGMTATPYRMDTGWIYERHYVGKMGSFDARFFKKCVYEVSLAYMIEHGFLTPPIVINAPVASYDFDGMDLDHQGLFSEDSVREALKSQARITPGIVKHILQVSEARQGVMIFASTIAHAKEVLSLLPEKESTLITGDTPLSERDYLISEFKKKNLKFLVNVSVLTTGFDAPHVDVIALLRPTESISLFQQIVGRGLRLSENKEDCLILDYTGSGYNIYYPEVGDSKPESASRLVAIPCPECEFENIFWAKVDKNDHIVEHYGRKCRGVLTGAIDTSDKPCGYRFRFKVCKACGAENDIAARVCHECKDVIVDPDVRLKEAMSLKNAHVMRPDSMVISKRLTKGRQSIEVIYYDLDGQPLREFFSFETPAQKKFFEYQFVRMHHKLPGVSLNLADIDDVIDHQSFFRTPMFVIAYKKQKFWQIREKVFYTRRKRPIAGA